MPPRPSRLVDEATGAIDVGLQRPQNTVVFVSTTNCWRCDAIPASPKNEVDLCDPCFEQLKEWSR